MLNRLPRITMTFFKATFVVLLLTVCFQTPQANAAPDTLVDAAWRAWQKPDYAQAERYFRTAVSADPSNERALLGLGLLENMQEKYSDCWDALRAVSPASPGKYAYLFSFWQTLRFRLKDQYKENGLLEYMKSLSDAADERGVLSAQVREALEEYYRERGDLNDANQWHDRIGAISDWMLTGPFENVSASGYDKNYAPEAEYNPSATYEGKGDVPASWFPIVSPVSNTWVDFTRHFPFRESIFYANTFVYVPAASDIHLRIGTSGSLRAFLNDEEMVACFDETNNDLDTYIVATRLQAGWNRLLIKCGCSEIQKCNFLVRITDEHGKQIQGLRVATAPQTYAHKPSAPKTVLENAFETFFKNQIDLHPDWPENYALIAQTYLRDDKAPQAELILRSALSRWPRCTLFHTLMLETYQRGNKQDEIDELRTKLSAIDDWLPATIGYRAGELLRNEEYDKLENLIADLKARNYDQETVYRILMELLGKRKEIDKLMTISAEAYARFPKNWEFCNLQAVIESEINHNPEKSASLIGDFLKVNYGSDQLNTQANYFLKAGKFAEWESAMKEALTLSPTATGYVYTMGLVYQLSKDYTKAEASFKHALELCPNSSLYWSKLAEVYKSTDRLEDAKSAYRTALRFDSRDFASREALRALENKKPVFSVFTTYSIDSLIRTAPESRAFPNDDAIILLDDTRRVVFEHGASMAMHESLVKVFNAKGIDAWKDYSIGYNAYNQDVIVEKAVTIKKDRTEVKADVDKGRIVFKSLEAGDCLYVRWKLKNYYNGMLARHFWDTHYINGFYPVAVDRYALVVPKGMQFTHLTQLAPDAPVIRQTEDGILYEWCSANEPAIQYEPGMPGLDDVGKVLFVSSLPSWEYVADWYSDLAKTKTRETFEIKEEVARLLEGKKGLTDEEKVKVIYDFITENIRYSSVPFRQSAYVPQTARDVLVQRLGDCKDVATLCIAMLNEAGVKAHYVLVNTWDDGFNWNVPPSIAFNHCIVGVELKNGVRNIDLTASNFALGSAPSIDKGAFALPIEQGRTHPVYLDEKQFSPNTIVRQSTAMVNEDNSLTMTCASTRSGEGSAGIRNRYRNKSAEERCKSLTEILSSTYPSVKVERVEVGNIDALNPRANDTSTYRVPQFLTDAGGFKLARMPWSDKLDPNGALSSDSRKFPYILQELDDTTTETLRLKLPQGYTLVEVPKPVKIANAVGEYSVVYKASRGEIVGTRVFVRKKTVLEPAEYLLYRSLYNEALREDGRQFLLRK